MEGKSEKKRTKSQASPPQQIQAKAGSSDDVTAATVIRMGEVLKNSRQLDRVLVGTRPRS